MDNEQHSGRSGVSRLVRGAFALAAVAASIGAGGCLTRPVAGLQPTTKTNVNLVVKQNAVDKVDLLFAIDNSRSMGDKQALLKDAVPDLIGRLLVPNCIDSTTDPKNPKTVARGADGKCPDPAKDEFSPVYDLHIGLVTSSLGGGGAESTGGQAICPPMASEPVYMKYNAHNDDKGHLINRKRPTAANTTGVEDTILDAVAVDGSGGNFLAWLPKVDKNTGKAAPNVPAIAPDPNNAVAFKAGQDQLISDFQTLVTGTQEYGCGLEAQMESWYRFLVQPDPYDAISINPDPNGGPPKAKLEGVDAVLLKQRHDFLRPDSLLAVIMLTDEEDSWSDPLAVGGRGWVTRASTFPGSPTNLMPRGTSACDSAVDPNNPATSGPLDPNCTSCGFAGNMANGQPIAGDANCLLGCGANCAGYWTGKDDNLNIRYVNDMKRRYGLDPQFPVSRYVNGLKSPKVPDRNGEHPAGAGSYLGKANCTNPLFASVLPTDPGGDLCNLPVGPRTSDLIYFAVLGGLPWQLLYDDKGDPTKGIAPGFKSSLSPQDWQSIVGKDPDHYDLTGIDPHMIETYLPRNQKNQAAIPYLQNPLPNDPSAGDTADPYNGREWDTTLSPLGLDLQYACTFALPTTKECSLPENNNACDCVKTAVNPGGPPLCAAGASGKSLQVRGKAYPTIRELRVARGLGAQAIVGSLCPKEPKNTASPDYGYRPAVRAIIDRLKNALVGQCLPQPLATDATGSVPCLILETLPGNGQGQAGSCDAKLGLNQPEPPILAKFNAARCTDGRGTGDAGPGGAVCKNPADAEQTAKDLGPVCQVTQLTAAQINGAVCEAVTTPGWCYVAGAAAGTCPQAIKFSATGGPSPGTKISLQCIETIGGGDGG